MELDELKASCFGLFVVNCDCLDSPFESLNAIFGIHWARDGGRRFEFGCS